MPLRLTEDKYRALVEKIRSLGAEVVEQTEFQNVGRYAATFVGTTISLSPEFDLFFKYFTVSHLYGHLVQLTRPTPEMKQAIGYTAGIGNPLTKEAVQIIHDYEYEAAEIGMTVIRELGHDTYWMRQQYTRMFYADFHYLINFIESGEGGHELFDFYMRRQPVPRYLIDGLYERLVNLNDFPALKNAPEVIVV